MALVPYQEIDYLEEARDRVTEQFKNKQIIDRYIQLLIDQQNGLQNVFKDLIQKRSIDEATGSTLDLIGEIVGQPRELVSADLYNFFGFLGEPQAESFGQFDDKTIGGYFYSMGTAMGGNILLDDETYRLFIKAKTLKNTTSCTPEEFIQFINSIFGTTVTSITEGPEAQFTVFIGTPLNSFQQALLNYATFSQGYEARLIPKPVGVGIGFGVFEEGNYFGFQGAPGAKGFGDFTGTYGYGLGYGIGFGASDYTTDFGGIFAELI